jgi:hypothetical protein
LVLAGRGLGPHPCPLQLPRPLRGLTCRLERLVPAPTACDWGQQPPPAWGGRLPGAGRAVPYRIWCTWPVVSGGGVVGAAVFAPVSVAPAFCRRCRIRTPRVVCVRGRQRSWVKTLPSSSGPAAVARCVSSTSLEASSKLLCLHQARVERPTRVLLLALLASADVNILLEGIARARLQPLTHYPCAFVVIRGSRRADACW